jgi:hypothetical protein
LISFRDRNPSCIFWIGDSGSRDYPDFKGKRALCQEELCCPQAIAALSLPSPSLYCLSARLNPSFPSHNAFKTAYPKVRMITAKLRTSNAYVEHRRLAIFFQTSSAARMQNATAALTTISY